ncbi:hypothetical protein [Rufibacter quisquiliarum]|uniref:Polysaccharide deacetylase n=1 Tax=Rufibacter quisquiliarum TaxID=1549639 RepID=A0A839GT68_9BACT|nr:hypothetical protein [Rufibacter quisquiliarum]MBA9076991.1 hypothetical protein [Rufibacter quisquiliarum]
MKTLLKKALYQFKSYPIPSSYNLQLGYIFHTEMVFNDKMFKDLLHFCSEFKAITGTQPICTVMSGVSPKVADGMRQHKCEDKKLADRYHELGGFATLGYHGHFYLNPALFKRKEAEIRSNNFSKQNLKEQFTRDLEWFSSHNLPHNGLYAAGWWFMNQHLLAMLIEAGFAYDFSFSKHIHFRNQFSHKLMLENELRAGEPFEITIPGQGSIKEIQNLTGSPSTPHFQDFTRNLLHILDPSQPRVTGVINSHDYDLDLKNTLLLFRNLEKLSNVSFFDANQLLDKRLNLSYKPVSLSSTLFEGPSLT